jgi:Ca2+-transporting ATPase
MTLTPKQPAKTPTQRAKAWHAETPAAARAAWQTSAEGLSLVEVERRRRDYGPNLLPEAGPTPAWRILGRQFASPLIYLLVAAAAVSMVIGDVKDAGFIVAVITLNAVIGAYQEWQAEQSSHALKKLLRMRAQVIRAGELQEIPSEEIVPGDIVYLESGNRLPADLRLLSAQGLEVDESLLTGESLPVTKDAEWLGAEDALLADRRNMTFAGSFVTRGRAQGIVVATGTETTLGQLALSVLGSQQGQPPLLERMERFTNYVAVGTLIAALTIGLLGIVVGNYTLVDTFFFVISLTVAAVPEGLPVAITVALAVATKRMARRNVIVRQLTAVEGLGSCTFIATDKTGTLTCNELTVREVCLPDGELLTVTGQGFSPSGEVLRAGQRLELAQHPPLAAMLRAAVLCNEADLSCHDGEWQWRGDAVDVAVLVLGAKLGLQRSALLSEFPFVSRIPFESENQCSISFHRHADQLEVFVKGAPERLLGMTGDQLSAADRERLHQLANQMAVRGLRVLAVASGRVTDPPDSQSVSDNLAVLDSPRVTSPLNDQPTNLTLLGFLGMIDPLRAGAREAVAECQRAGVLVSMVTGDHRTTALAIARDLGLAEREEQVVTAADLTGKTPQELAALIPETRVFARVTPQQKLQIVEAAREAGHFVAVTGDGVNDAPALRAANIGVAMGMAGTDVAREASELVLSDDNFRSIVGGIEEGRIAYDNIRKVIYLLVSMGASELLLMLLAVVKGLPVPLLPVQLLWLNLVTDGIQAVALAFEPGDGDSLNRQPRSPAEPIFNRLMLERLLVAVLVVGGGGFLIFDICLQAGWAVEDARNFLLLSLVLFENFHGGNCRSETRSIFALSPLRSPVLFFGSLCALLIHISVMVVPMLQGMLGTKAIEPSLWGVAILVSMLIVPAMELQKWSWARRQSARMDN